MAPSIEQLFGLAIAAFRASKLEDAEQYFKEILQRDPQNIAALNLLGIVLVHHKKFAEAEPYLVSALNINSGSDATFYNYALTLTALNRPDEALERFSQALAINSNVAETWNSRGIILHQLKRYEDAISDFDKAIALKPNYSDAYCNKGKSLRDTDRFDEALAVYMKVLAANPSLVEIWSASGDVLFELKRHDEASAAYKKALSLNPNVAEIWFGLANAYVKLNRYNDALDAYESALSLKPDFASAWYGRGNALHQLGLMDEAAAAYDRAFALDSEQPSLEGLRLIFKLHVCDWSNFYAEYQHLVSSVESKIECTPFTLLVISSSKKLQMECAEHFASKQFPPFPVRMWNGDIYKHHKIRIGYMSSDFRQHAISNLVVGMLECHDKSKFETIAISIGPNDNSEIRTRIEQSVGKFIDARTLTDNEVAATIRKEEIDLLIDLNGFTRGMRTAICAFRPAPIQINYLGYPGTMGAEYMDYLIADEIVIPHSHQKFYREKIVYLPNCYQANDSNRPISKMMFTRASANLPDTGFVFCCFNNNYKILPNVFDGWMRILKQVDRSVLWLIEGNNHATENMKKEAASRGVSADRLVFAKRLPLADHLARHQLADLFLDTLPYNAHTTASDALWAGLPVLTQIGDTFAGRVAASLLNAIGLPELVAPTAQSYEDLAIELAMNPRKLAAIRQKLASKRLSKPLFDTQLFTRHIEAAYLAMYERYQAGLPTGDIRVPIAAQN